MLDKRLQILVDNQMWDKLSTLAKKQRTSIGKLTRSAVEKVYFEKENEVKQKRAKAVDAIRAFRSRYGNRYAKKNSVDIIRKMREERTNQMFDLITEKNA